MVSIIFPLFKDEENFFLKKSLDQLKDESGIEVICVLNEKDSTTTHLLNQYDFVKVIPTSFTARGKKLEVGIQNSTGETILLHHPRSFLAPEAIHLLKKNPTTWGGFTHTFDLKHPLLGFTSFYSNFIRGDLRGIYYLDHCLYGPRELFLKILPLPDVSIFEDTIICMRLLTHSKNYKRLNPKSTTSAIRFKKNGVFKQALLNQKLKYQFLRGSDLNKMNEQYEKGCELNNSYSLGQSRKRQD